MGMYQQPTAFKKPDNGDSFLFALVNLLSSELGFFMPKLGLYRELSNQVTPFR